MDWSARTPVILGLLTLTIFLGGFGLWSVTAHISGAIISPGTVSVAQDRQIIQHPDGGVVTEIFVENGHPVVAGDILLRFDDELIQSRLGMIKTQLLQTTAQRDRLQAERDGKSQISFDPILLTLGTNTTTQAVQDGQNRLFNARRDTQQATLQQLNHQRDQIHAQIGGLHTQLINVEKQAALVLKQLTAIRTLLGKGLAQTSQVMQLESSHAEFSGTIGALTASIAGAAGRKVEIDLNIAQINAQQHEETITMLGEVILRESALHQELGTLNLHLSRMVVIAPTNGIVHGLNVYAPQTVIRPAEPIMYLIPQDRQVVINIQIRRMHIDQISIGQDVTIKLNTFDQATTPELAGHIAKVSADVFEGPAGTEPYYLGTIHLEPGQLTKLQPNQTLVPGLPIDAFVRTGEQSPLAYLVKPLASYFAGALRES